MWTVKTLLSDDWRPRLIKTSLGLNATYEIPIKIVIVIKPVIFLVQIISPRGVMPLIKGLTAILKVRLVKIY